MGKPLLTDEIIAKSKYKNPSEYDLEETKVLPVIGSTVSDYESFERDESETPYKSRRLENSKRNEFQKKLNLILFVVVCLLVLLVYAIIKL